MPVRMTRSKLSRSISSRSRAKGSCAKSRSASGCSAMFLSYGLVSLMNNLSNVELSSTRDHKIHAECIEGGSGIGVEVAVGHDYVHRVYAADSGKGCLAKFA